MFTVKQKEIFDVVSSTPWTPLSKFSEYDKVAFDALIQGELIRVEPNEDGSMFVGVFAEPTRPTVVVPAADVSAKARAAASKLKGKGSKSSDEGAADA